MKLGPPCVISMLLIDKAMSTFEQSAIEQPTYPDADLARFAALTPNEFVALTRTVFSDDYIPASESPVYQEDIFNALHAAPEHDIPRAIALMTAFADSPLPEDRKFLANTHLVDLVKASHDDGVALWNRLMADPVNEVGDEAELLLAEYTGGRNLWPNTGFYKIDHIDESWLTHETGLTRQDVYDLYLSYAYTENDICFDLGRTALAKIGATEPPVQ